MNKLQSLFAYPCVFFVLLSFYACNEQNKTHLTNEHAAPSTENLGEKTLAENHAVNQAITDPLFYIEGQLCAWVRNIFQDSRGNLWFATNHYGVMRYDGDTLEYFDEEQGLGRGRVTEIVEDNEGNVWIGTYGGLSKYDPRDENKSDSAIFTNYADQVGLVDNEIWSLALDSKGRLWLGTMEGLSRFDGNTFTEFPLPKAPVTDTTSLLSPNRITAIIEDKLGNMWFGTDGFGMSKYDGKSFTHFTQEDGLCDNNVYDLMEDRKGNIWIGTMFGGISRFDGNTFTNFTQDSVISGVEAGGAFRRRPRKYLVCSRT